jgi:peptidylprolyl isomerase
MQTVKSGDTVSVHYRGTLENGAEFDSSAGGDPLQFTVGAGQVIQGFDDAVMGMQVGDKKQERIPAERAYGPYNPDLVFDVDRANIPPDSELEEGDVVEITFENGESAPVRIAEMTDDSLKLDANHPLAGKMLIFDLELVGIG